MDVLAHGRISKANSILDIGGHKPVVGSMLETGDSPVIIILGDSTGNETTEWAYIMGQHYAALNPNMNVRHALFNASTNRYDAWTDIQYAGDYRYMQINTTNSPYHPIIANSEVNITSPDLDISIKVALDDWATTTGYKYFVSKMNSPDKYGWGLELDNHFVRLYWSEDGTNIKQFNTTINTAGFAAGEVHWLRCTLDVNDGAGHYVAAAYTSTDGSNWTQAATNTGASTTSIFADSSVDYKFGRDSTGASLAGKYYEIKLRDGINGPNVFPQPIESWGRGYGTPGEGTIGGTPTLHIYNCSISGYGLADYTADLVNRAVPKTYGAKVIISLGHNDTTRRFSEYITAWGTFLTAVKANALASSKYLMTQNPIISPAADVMDRIIRRRILMGFASDNGIKVIDDHLEFLKDPRGVSALVESDGVHPNTAGKALQAAAVWKYLSLT